MLKTHHKMRCWNREFQYLSARIVGEMAKCQYLSTKTMHFSLTFHTLSPLSHIPLSPPPGSHSTLGHSLSVLDAPYLSLFSCISPEGWARSWLFLRPCVRACVRPPPRGSSKHMLLHHTVWNFRKSHLYFTVLSSRRPQNTLWNCYFFRQMLKTHHKMRGWNREFQYLPTKIIGEIVKYQYLPAKTIHFSLSHLTLSSLSHTPLSPLFSWL